MHAARSPVLTLLAVVAVLLGSCAKEAGTDPKDMAMDVMEAKAALEELIVRTSEGVTATGALRVESDNGPAPCESAQLGQVVDTKSATLTMVLPVARGEERAALDEVRATWETESLRLDRSRYDDERYPELLAAGTGFGVSVLAVPDTGQISFMGQTDCLEDPGG